MTTPTTTPTTTLLLERLTRTRVVSVVRTHHLPDASALCSALAAGGIGVVELTFTIPDLADHLREASALDGVVVGAGTVRAVGDARVAIDAGAQFLVTPGLVPDAAAIVAAGREAGLAVILGALTPSEVATAHALGADVVKVFPARLFGAQYFRDLSGPFPDIPLLPSGGVNADNAGDFLAAGAIAVSAGTDVVPPDAVADARWAEITTRATEFCAALP